jgi:hypothetical protein
MHLKTVSLLICSDAGGRRSSSTLWLSSQSQAVRRGAQAILRGTYSDASLRVHLISQHLCSKGWCKPSAAMPSAAPSCSRPKKSSSSCTPRGWLEGPLVKKFAPLATLAYMIAALYSFLHLKNGSPLSGCGCDLESLSTRKKNSISGACITKQPI